jgi:acyl-CoA dehydrogenase
VAEGEGVALAATEEGGGHPKAILTSYSAGLVTGSKAFVTLGAEAERVLVVCREPAGRLRVVSVTPRQPGVTVTPLPPTPFAPEIPHAAMRFEGVPGEALPGDGYDDYLKPFRTVEDIHVFAAAIGYLREVGRRSMWRAETLARLAAVGAALVALARQDPRAPETHLALAGALDLGRQVIDACDFQAVDADEAARWRRDRPLLDIAGKVRALRFASACRALGLDQAL